MSFSISLFVLEILRFVGYVNNTLQSWETMGLLIPGFPLSSQNKIMNNI